MRMMRGEGDDREAGFVAVFIALTLVIMLIFAAFTVDFGSWYTRSAEIKRAADAAALAGVVWMPEFDQAQQAAVDTAKRNGFVDGQNDISVHVDTVPNNNRQLRVTIRDNRAKQFFSRLVTQSQSIGRSSLAEYVLPVPMGSPENVFGTGNLSLSGQAATQNFWAAVNGFCAGHESGDPKLAWWESYDTSGNGCNGNNSAQNVDDYDPNGYLYAIDLPQNVGSMKLDVYDGAYNRSGSSMDSTLCGSCSESITTKYTVYDRNPTPLDTSDTNLNTLAFTPINVTTNQSGYQNTWTNLHTWTNPHAGRYYVRVQTDPSQTSNSRGSNGFALRAWTGSSFSVCSTLTGSSTCPQLHAVSDMSIYANLDTGGSGSQATFYLAQIDPIHAGKTMRVNLFDAGEGAKKLEVLDPNGNPATFNWSTPCSPQTPPSGGCSGSGTSLDVSNTGCPRSGCPQPYSTVNSDSKYSDRFLTVDIPLPANYTTKYGTKTWWKIRYTVGSSSTDRTTWSVNIVGDPVHLLQ
jgi:hypothetical protein